jgi:hypothetical protein
MLAIKPFQELNSHTMRNTKTDLRGTEYKGMDWIQLAQDRDEWLL